ncbi:MAG TPA: ParA family protein [Anaerolineales bacterium]|nr:ParA family protein [Anaerolineae bacterium]HIQ01804.1 ParA family protein [Anaerolineales bacterium]
MSIRVLIATRNWQDAGAVAAALQDLNEIQVVGNPRSYQEVLDDAQSLGAQVVLLSPELTDYRPDLVAALLQLDPPVATVALAPPTGDWATEMYRQGAAGHVNLPLTGAATGRLAETIRQAAAQATQMQERATFTPAEVDTLAELAAGGWRKSTVAVYSPKGGDGKTFFATNLAVALGVIGKRATLLIDADVKANAHVALHLPEDRNLFGLLLSVLERGNGDEVTPRTLRLFVTHYGDPRKSHLDVLVGFPRLELAGHQQLRGRNEARVRQVMLNLLRTAGQLYDFVILDCGPDYNYPVVWAAVEGADRTLFVTTPIETSIKCVKDGLDLMRKAFAAEDAATVQRFNLLINRYTEEAGVRPGDIVDVLGLPQFGLVPHAGPAVDVSLNTHTPLVLMRKKLDGPAAEAADGVAAVAASLYPPFTILWERVGGRIGRRERKVKKRRDSRGLRRLTNLFVEEV